MKSKHWETMTNLLDKYFPKGLCRERGKAIVLLAYIEMMLLGAEFDENGNLTKAPKCHI